MISTRTRERLSGGSGRAPAGSYREPTAEEKLAAVLHQVDILQEYRTRLGSSESDKLSDIDATLATLHQDIEYHTSRESASGEILPTPAAMTQPARVLGTLFAVVL